MKNQEKRAAGARVRVALCTGAVVVAALALACSGGGGGGGSPGSTSRIVGALSKTGAVRVASSSFHRSLLARAGAWLGLREAIADGPTGESGCGNPLDPAAGITVTLFSNADLTTPVATTVTDSGGNFVFTAVAPGDYVIQVTLADGKTISAPVIVQPSQTTNVTGELDVDCRDVNGNGDTSEPALHVEMDTDDGSVEMADETVDGGSFKGRVQEADGGVKTETGQNGDRSDEVDVEDGKPDSSKPDGTSGQSD